MRADNADFSAYNTASSKRPRVVVCISFNTANTDLLYLTSHADCDLPSNVTSINNVVRSISGQTQKINPDQANSTIGAFSFSSIDKTITLTTSIQTKLLAGDGLRKKRVIVYIGGQGMLFANYTPAITCIIDGVSYNNGEYKFTCSDIQREVRKQIFEPEVTYLSKTVTASQMHIPCLATDLTKFPAVEHDSSYTVNPSVTVQYGRIEDEIYCHSGLFTHGTDGVSFQVVARGALNSKAVEHVMDATVATDRRLKITEHIFIEGASPKVVYQLLTGHVSENLLTYSEDFTNAVWTDPTSQWTVVANTDVAPDGTTTADEVTVTAAGNALMRVVTSPTIAGGLTHTASVWVKLKSGTVTSIDIDLGDGIAKSFALTSQWQRISYTVASHATNNWVDFNIVGASAGARILPWGGQLTKTSALTPYYKTTATARPKKTLPSNWHLGIDHVYVRASDFTNLGNDLWNVFTDAGRQCRFEGLKKIDGKRFIETELLIWLGAFMPIYSTGELGLRRLAPVLESSGYTHALNKNNIVDYSDLTHDYNSVINQSSVDWNYVFSKQEYTKTAELIDADSYTTHRDAPKKNLKLRGVHTGSHTDEDIINYFNSTQGRYSGPPLRLSVTVLPSLNWLEVGDTVRVTLDEIRDFTAGSGVGLDRVFEIQQVDYDWLTGDVKLDLFGSSMKAGSAIRSTLSSVLDNAFYNSAGTELSTVLTIVAGAVTASGSLAGGATMAEGIYYYLGNLTIDASVIATINNNVQLRIRGSLTINGTINGKGLGAAGGAGATLWSNGLTTFTGPTLLKHNAGAGVSGAVGITKPGSEFYVAVYPSGILAMGYGRYAVEHVRQGLSSIPYYSLKNNSTSIIGLPNDLRGNGGAGSGGVHSYIGTAGVLQAAGGAGGAGGAGLMIISRGLSFGAAGKIDLSGADGISPGTSYKLSKKTLVSSSGAGGAPGGFALFLDGNYTPPELATELVSLHGDSPIIGDVWDGGVLDALSGPSILYSNQYGIQGFDMGDAAYTLQYIPPVVAATEEKDSPPPDVTGFTAVNDGLNAKLSWTAVVNNNAVQYRIKSGTVWSSGTLIADVKTTAHYILMTTITTYNFMIKALDSLGRESAAVATATLNGAPEVNYNATLAADDFSGGGFYYRAVFDKSFASVNISNATIDVGGFIRLSSATSAWVYSGIAQTNANRGLGKSKWRYRCTFMVPTGTGSTLPTAIVGTATDGLFIGVGRANAIPNSGEVGLIAIWNSGTSLIDIYAHSRRGGAATNALITSIADTGILVTSHCFRDVTTGDFTATLTIASIDYSVVITTNTPVAQSAFVPMRLEIAKATAGTAQLDVYEFQSLMPT